jgi:hypothetical protein
MALPMQCNQWRAAAKINVMLTGGRHLTALAMPMQ